jgi:hypothetical protein
MSVTMPRAPRLRLHRETVRSLTVSRAAAGQGPTFDPACNTSECDITLGCTQFGCAPTHPAVCIVFP